MQAIDTGAKDWGYVIAIQDGQKQLDYTEHSMYGLIERLQSIEETVKKFGRL